MAIIRRNIRIPRAKPMIYNDYGYDIETYPNVFTLTARHILSKTVYVFEISNRLNDVYLLLQWFGELERDKAARMVGYNCIGFDWNLCKLILETPPHLVTSELIYQFSQRIFQSKDRFEFSLRDFEIAIPQVDLYLIHHFDNVAKATSLKKLEFVRRSHNIKDLPFPPGTVLADWQIDELLKYNLHDVDETIGFYHDCIKEIRFREKLSLEWGVNLVNKNDTAIGVEYFKRELTAQGVNMGKDARTYRHSIGLAEIIFPYIHFSTPQFNNVLSWLKGQRITETKGVFKNLSATINGFTFDFGTGGIHGSIPARRVVADSDHCILDLDVTSYYPNLAIKNGLAPEHLGAAFCMVYEQAYNLRAEHDKGTMENALFKLAINAIFGKANSEFSPFYDPAFAMAVTINGQLLLCMFAEWLMQVPGLTMLQINTDGVSVHLPRSSVPMVNDLARQWEAFTLLTLETVEYSQMAIRDVNNYLAVEVGGDVKTKGAYSHKRAWHQNHSALVVPKAAQAFILQGIDPETFIRNHDDLFDFMMLAKVPRSSTLLHDELPIQGTSRYYAATQGGYLIKQMPPTPIQISNHAQQKRDYNDPYGTWAAKIKIVGKWGGPPPETCPNRRIGIDSRQKVMICNDIFEANPSLIDFNYYIAEAQKLINAF